jgi:hypothetical protein
MAIDPEVAREGADWIAEMVSEELGGFIPSELCDLVMETEQEIREESGDDEMDHEQMASRIMTVFKADPEIPTQPGGVSQHVVVEILHWEDEFLTMAGHPRNVRPS